MSCTTVWEFPELKTRQAGSLILYLLLMCNLSILVTVHREEIHFPRKKKFDHLNLDKYSLHRAFSVTIAKVIGLQSSKHTVVKM